MDAPFIGSLIFEFIGVFFRWVYISIKNVIKGEKVVSFNKVWKGKKSKDFKKNIKYGMSNITLGIIIVIVIIVILKIII